MRAGRICYRRRAGLCHKLFEPVAHVDGRPPSCGAYESVVVAVYISKVVGPQAGFVFLKHKVLFRMSQQAFKNIANAQ